MPDLSRPTSLEPQRPPTLTDQVFDALYRQVMTLELPPGTRMSEAEIATVLGVSRQPVRDAFWRLARLGFLQVRPQRATTVSPISAAAVREAKFIRTALEVETIRLAAVRLSAADLAALRDVLGEQASAIAVGDRDGFHALDEAYHRQLCARAGVGFAWTLIREKKAHMDRVRYLSLTFGAPAALEDHLAIQAALEARDIDAAVAAVRTHLGRIEPILTRVQASHGGLFAVEG